VVVEFITGMTFMHAYSREGVRSTVPTGVQVSLKLG
jgi:hypothetical protein